MLPTGGLGRIPRWSLSRNDLVLQVPSLQQCLLFAATDGNRHDRDLFGHAPVNDAVGFEKYLWLLGKPDGQQFFWIGSSLRVLAET
jgi:hypothetical protein